MLFSASSLDLIARSYKIAYINKQINQLKELGLSNEGSNGLGAMDKEQRQEVILQMRTEDSRKPFRGDGSFTEIG